MKDAGTGPAGGGSASSAASSRGSARYYADVPNRLAAFLIDAVLLTLLIFCGAIAVSLALGPAVEFDPSSGSLEEVVTLERDVAVVDAVLSLLLSALYFAGSWRRWDATPGQRLVGIRVVSAPDGGRLGLGRAALRWALLGAPFGLLALLTTAVPDLPNTVPDVLVAAWYLVLLVTTAVGRPGQGLHDRLAGSVVTMRAREIAGDVAHRDAH